MRRRPRTALSLLLLAGLAAAAPATAAPPLRLVSPAAGTELVAGSQAVLEWEAVADLGHAEEWEAFLSLDGGRTYPLRLTPHLDLSIRRFAFRVPDLPTSRARLLIRYGDEREEEEEAEAPWTFEIAAGPRPSAFTSPSLVQRFSPGESARRGDRGVVVWTEGTRGGSGLRVVAARKIETSLESVAPASPLLLGLAWPAPGREDLPLPAVADATFPTASRQPASRTDAPAAHPAEVRLLIHRYNE
jgi:hypothetical protein